MKRDAAFGCRNEILAQQLNETKPQIDSQLTPTDKKKAIRLYKVFFVYKGYTLL